MFEQLPSCHNLKKNKMYIPQLLTSVSLSRLYAVGTIWNAVLVDPLRALKAKKKKTNLEILSLGSQVEGTLCL